MNRLSILVGRLIKSMAPTKYFVKVPLVGRFMPLVGGIGLLVESPLYIVNLSIVLYTHRLVTDRLVEIDIFGRPERFVWPTN